MFPIEAILMTVILGALSPALFRLRLLPNKGNLRLKAQHYILLGVLTLLAVGLVVFYVTFLKDYVKAHNFKLW